MARVLLIAEAANPEWVSVPLIGWSLARALAARADVHLVTHIRNRDAILRAGLIEGRDFTAIDSDDVAGPIWKIASRLRGGEGKGWTMLQLANALSYPRFEQLIWRAFGPRIRAGEFDIVHRITPLSPTMGSRLAKRCAKAGVPFVVGPLNGGVPWPKAFTGARLAEKEYLSYLRSAYKVMPARRAMLRHASAIIAGSGHTALELPDSVAGKLFYLPENAIDPARFHRSAGPAGQPMRACFIGRMVPYKGPDMLLDAAAPLLRDGRLTLEMIGDGPLTPALKEQAARLGVTQAVSFHGWLEHRQVQDVAARCALFTFPSIREFGGGAVIEAMALGLAPLIVDYAGPTELVTDDTAFRIPLGTRDEIVSHLTAELASLCADPARVTATGARARARVAARDTWQARADQILQIYDFVLNGGDKPCPLPPPALGFTRGNR